MSDEGGSGSRSDADRAASIAGGVEDASKALGTSVGGLVGSAAGAEAQRDVERGFTAAGEAAGAAAQAARAVEQARRGTDAARRGDGAGTAAGTLGGAAGLAGLAGGALGALGSATGDARLQDAARVARTVQATASLASTLAREIGAAIGTQRHVRYQLTIESCEDALEVRSFALTEALSRPYEMILQVRCDNRDLDVTTIVGRNASVLLDRGGEHNRRVCGIIDRVAERGGREHHTELELRVVPALTLLGKVHGRLARAPARAELLGIQHYHGAPAQGATCVSELSIGVGAPTHGASVGCEGASVAASQRDVARRGERWVDEAGTAAGTSLGPERHPTTPRPSPSSRSTRRGHVPGDDLKPGLGSRPRHDNRDLGTHPSPVSEAAVRTHTPAVGLASVVARAGVLRTSRHVDGVGERDRARSEDRVGVPRPIPHLTFDVTAPTDHASRSRDGTCVPGAHRHTPRVDAGDNLRGLAQPGRGPIDS
ncbi:MAG: hypothetical protein KF729_36475 [Sandaracinaceae bacterium]|nr:hypothetical protein [Sandaracinaceae bacterium]